MPVELALTPDSRWTDGTAELAAAVGAAGFAGLGLGADRASAPGAAEVLAGAGLRCSELLALLVSRNEERTLASASQLAAAAAAVGAPWVLTVPAAPPSAAAAALLGRCADVVAEAGARLAVEFSPLGVVTSIPAARELIAAADPGRTAVMVDTWHFTRGDSTWADLEQIPLEEIAYLQFSDALAPVGDDGFDETMNRRVWPGEGTFELERFASVLRDRDWSGTVSVEVLNADLARLPVAEFARAAYTSTAPYWS
ncbi:sugar phosphate isomerase/epimerase [Blastococcus sp. TF02A-26]|uniref:sugar phosphate isomerase/epimerase family protein n=1 Tax=Blastococcus sp. TF02A-26 TaxID=2250577 RepID=UPI000DE94E45|nr:TIM barrel protein [Blastococcus sp. TF02A-26]RBY83179.1 sugar phosphate isomerase/epimerase [Blastococcus sp. TF02A-26]